MITGLIEGSYLWKQESREKLQQSVLKYYQKGFIQKDKFLYSLWKASLNHIIKKRDIRLYSTIFEKLMINPFEEKKPL